MLHVDYSAQNEMMGVKPTYISAGKYKVEGNPDAPLDDEARGHLQELVDDAYAAFVKAVARGRGVSTGDVRKGYGEGRFLPARRAAQEGMVDRIGTLEGAIAKAARLGARQRSATALRAADELRGESFGHGAPDGSPKQKESSDE
jgi:ClpP class serine protease